MFRRIFTIAFLYLKTTYSSRAALIFSIAMPLLFTFVLGQAMQAGFGDEPPTSWPLAVVDEDNSELSQKFIARLEANSTVEVEMTDREAALASLEDDSIAAVIIPAGFGDALSEGNTVALEFRQNVNEITTAQILQEAVNAAAAELSGSVAAAELSIHIADRVGLLENTDAETQAVYKAQAFKDAENEWGSGAPVAVEFEAVTRMEEAQIPVGASQSSPGMLVMYALFFTFGGGASLLVERDEGTLRRLLVMPMGKATILTGKLLGIFIGALVQMAIMILAGQFVFGVQWGQEPLALIVMLLAYGFTSTALGLMVAALARTVAQANAAGTIAIMALASLGGAWWPIEIVPQWMQSVALVLPTGWAMRGFHDVITRGLDLNAIWLEVGVLAGFGLLFLAVGAARFKYE
jgi:ABC-2 type transport system permease protein